LLRKSHGCRLYLPILHPIIIKTMGGTIRCMVSELEVAIKAARKAGAISLGHFGKAIGHQMKPDNSPVTRMDRLCEREMLRIVRSAFPDDSILAEESGRQEKDPERRWIIDPIDGTKSFIRGLPFYGNLIAFEDCGEITAGAICVPAMGLLLHAEKGRGAYENGRKIRVSRISELEEAYILHGRGKGFLEKGYLKKLRLLLNGVYHSWGIGDVYGYCLLACGKVDALIETFPHPWDVAAPKIIVEEAGGKFSDLSNNPTIFSNTIAIGSNGLIHSQLIDILRK